MALTTHGIEHYMSKDILSLMPNNWQEIFRQASENTKIERRVDYSDPKNIAPIESLGEIVRGVMISSNKINLIKTLLELVVTDSYEVKFRIRVYDAPSNSPISLRTQGHRITYREVKSSAMMKTYGYKHSWATRLMFQKAGPQEFREVAEIMMSGISQSFMGDMLRDILSSQLFDDPALAFNMQKFVSIRERLEHEVRIFNSTRFGEWTATMANISAARKRMLDYDVEPDVFLCASEFPAVIAEINEYNHQYSMVQGGGGDRLPNVKEGGEDLKKIRKMEMIQVPPIFEKNVPYQLLNRHKVAGEFYDGSMGAMRFAEFGGAQKFHMYKSSLQIYKLYNHNTDTEDEIPLELQIMNSQVFGINQDYSPHMFKLLDKYQKNDLRIDFHNPDDPRVDGHFLITSGNANDLMLARLWGQLQLGAALPKHYEATAYSMIGFLSGKLNISHEKLNQDHEHFLSVYRMLQEVPYNDEFFRRTSDTNLPHSLREGVFYGENTSEDVMKYWGTQFEAKGWTQNIFGGMDLPKQDEKDGIYPPGYATLPGMETLAAEGTKNNSTWKEASETIIPAMKHFHRIAEAMFDALQMGESLFAPFDPQYRSPWFHSKGPHRDWKHAFFEVLVQSSHAPLFLACANLA